MYETKAVCFPLSTTWAASHKFCYISLSFILNTFFYYFHCDLFFYLWVSSNIFCLLYEHMGIFYLLSTVVLLLLISSLIAL